MLIRQLNRVGEKTEKALQKLGINTVLDLLFYFPFRYENYEVCEKISDIKAGKLISVKGQIDLIRNRRSFRRRLIISEALIKDESASLEVIWFNQAFISKNLKAGDFVSLAGKVKEQNGRLIMLSPVYEKINKKQEKIHTNNIVPIYSLSASLTQKQLRFLIHQALSRIKKIPEYLPREVIRSQELIAPREALQKIHFPQKQKDIDLAVQRFKFAELFLFQLKSYLIKERAKQKTAPAIPIKIKEIKKLIASLPYTLTPQQKKAAWEIISDLNKKVPMSRLLQGDVGSGKTIVALLAAFNCMRDKGQVVFMAPSEILAKQHFGTAQKVFAAYDFKIALLSSKLKEANFPLSEKKSEQIQQITQEADLIFGTQALIQENIKFKNLALAIVDEQHLFGVNQRQEIINKNIGDEQENSTAHFLSMTATPIPRSLALLQALSLDFSLIGQKPESRPPIITKIIKKEKEEETYEFIKKEIENGRQAFIICPLIDPSDKLGAKSVKEEYQRLKNNVFPNIAMEMLHGKMKSEEKNAVMERFAKNETKIIVSTSVVEVGIDVPNATVILIEGAERFGLAQIHQFRGRVGRGQHKSYCFLHLSDNKSNVEDYLFDGAKSQASWERLAVLEECDNGLELAKIDLKNRGSGDFYGLEQSGQKTFRFASFLDERLIEAVNYEIKRLSLEDPELKNEPQLLKKINSDIEKVHLE